MKRNPYLVGAYVLGATVIGDDSENDFADSSDEALVSLAVQEVAAAIQQMNASPNSDNGLTVDGGGRPGAFTPPSSVQRQALASPLEEVSDEDWTKFVAALRTADLNSVTDSGALGMFGFKLRRLEDIGLMKNVSPINDRKKGKGKMSWTGDWVLPLSQDIFLGSPSIQYRALAASSQLYTLALTDGEIKQPEIEGEISLSGVLALLHKCGARGFEQWSDKDKRKPSTIALFEAANGLF
jgi:hypothetical protein